MLAIQFDDTGRVTGKVCVQTKMAVTEGGSECAEILSRWQAFAPPTENYPLPSGKVLETGYDACITQTFCEP